MRVRKLLPALFAVLVTYVPGAIATNAHVAAAASRDDLLGQALTLALPLLLLLSEAVRGKFAHAVMGFPLFSRLERSTLLDHARRESILDLIRENPGIRFNEIRRRCAFGTGDVLHHLRLLERHGFIQSERGRQRTAFRTPAVGPKQT